MNTPANQDELFDLLDALVSGAIAPAEHQRLEAILAADPSARQFYFDYLDMHLQLRRWQRAEGSDERSGGRGQSPAVGAAVELPHQPDAASAEPLISPIIIDTSSPGPAPLLATLFAPGGWLFSYGAALVITGVMLLVLWTLKVSQQRDLANAPSAPTASRVEYEGLTESVGQITAVAECRWADPQDAPPAAVSLGRRYELASGLVEIAYKTGARVILEGPCEYEVDSAAGGFLALGKLTAKVEKLSAISYQLSAAEPPKSQIPNPNFVVRTPTAVVTDLGTEFGVEVEASGATRSQVFRGKVEMRTVVDDGKRHEAVLLMANDSARVETGRDGTVRVVRQAAQPDRFQRQMPQWIRYTFDDGTAQGWAAVPGLDGDAAHGFVVTPLRSGVGVDAQSGHWYVFGLRSDNPQDFPFYPYEDTPHPTITFRSPPFVLDGSGDLTFYLCGGPAGMPAPTNIAEIPKNSIADTGFMGMALERVSDGALVLSATVTGKPHAPGRPPDWQCKTFTAAQLAPFVDNGLYRLVLIDYKHGDWGWVALDTVTIPGRLVEPAAEPKAKEACP